MRATASCVCLQVGQNVEDYRRTECASHVPAIRNFFKVQQIKTPLALRCFTHRAENNLPLYFPSSPPTPCPALLSFTCGQAIVTHDCLFWFVVTISCPRPTSCCISVAPAFKWSLCGIRTEAGGGGGAWGFGIEGFIVQSFDWVIGETGSRQERGEWTSVSVYDSGVWRCVCVV